MSDINLYISVSYLKAILQRKTLKSDCNIRRLRGSLVIGIKMTYVAHADVI